MSTFNKKSVNFDGGWDVSCEDDLLREGTGALRSQTSWVAECVVVQELSFTMSVSHVSSAFKVMREMHQLTHHPRAGCQLESKINVVEASLPPSLRDLLRYSRLVSSSCIGNTSLCIFIISSVLPRYKS
jgi:hypothetical protein